MYLRSKIGQDVLECKLLASLLMHVNQCIMVEYSA